MSQVLGSGVSMQGSIPMNMDLVQKTLDLHPDAAVVLIWNRDGQPYVLSRTDSTVFVDYIQDWVIGDRRHLRVEMQWVDPRPDPAWHRARGGSVLHARALDKSMSDVQSRPVYETGALCGYKPSSYWAAPSGAAPYCDRCLTKKLAKP